MMALFQFTEVNIKTEFSILRLCKRVKLAQKRLLPRRKRRS